MNQLQFRQTFGSHSLDKDGLHERQVSQLQFIKIKLKRIVIEFLQIFDEEEQED